ncbi:MAG: TonB-dependent receptor [Pseudomonadota bacterium]|nr:TonB-dependent receptor [Pseudomonadota bacterium]
MDSFLAVLFIEASKMRTLSLTAFLSYFLFGLTGILLGNNVVAESHSAKAVDEITVTARKREESLQSVPISVTAFSADDIKNRDIGNLERLADQTPGLSFGTTGSIVGRRAVIRGMSQTTRVGDETNVASFVDGVYIPGFSGAEFFGFDSLERVEVIKGPQSAIYGRNSFAGAINYVTKKPTDDFEYGGQLTLGESDREGINGFISGPAFDEAILLRLDAGHNKSGGTNKNSTDGNALGSTETEFARISAAWDVSDKLNIDWKLSWQEDDVNSVPLTIVADDDPNRVGKKLSFASSPFEFFAGGGDQIGRLYKGAITDTSDIYTIDSRAYAGKRESIRSALTINYGFDGFDFISVTGFQDREAASLGDFNTCRVDIRAAVCDTVDPNAIGTFIGGPLADSPKIINVLTGRIEDRDELSQDLRLQSTGEGPLNWTAGIYYSTEDFDDLSHRLSDQTLTNIDGTNIYALASTVPLIDSTTIVSNDFSSIYGSIDYDLDEQWSTSIEARYTREEKSANQTGNNFPSATPPTGLQEKTFRFFTPRLILNYNPNDEVLVYGSVAKGVKSGGFNPGSVTLSTYDEEENWTYELGSKFTLLDGRARLNSSIYYVDWTDQQITSTDPDNTRLPITINVAKTEIKGFEIEGFWSATDWLDFNAGATFIDAEYTEGNTVGIELLVDCENLPIPCDVVLPGLGISGTSGNVAGRKVIGTPETTYNVGAEVSFPVAANAWEFVGRLDYAWLDKIFIDEANSGWIPSRETVNLRVGLRNDNWGVDAFCNNLTDDDTPLFAVPPRDILGVPHFGVVNRDGRLCGLQVSYRN